MTLLDTIRLAGLPLLSADLLHPTQAHPEPLRQFRLGAFARRIRCPELPSQIIFVGSRHTLPRSPQELPYSNTRNALNKLQLPGLDLGAAKRMASSAMAAVKQGQLGYVLIRATKPDSH